MPLVLVTRYAIAAPNVSLCDCALHVCAHHIVRIGARHVFRAAPFQAIIRALL